MFKSLKNKINNFINLPVNENIDTHSIEVAKNKIENTAEIKEKRKIEELNKELNTLDNLVLIDGKDKLTFDQNIHDYEHKNKVLQQELDSDVQDALMKGLPNPKPIVEEKDDNWINNIDFTTEIKNTLFLQTLSTTFDLMYKKYNINTKLVFMQEDEQMSIDLNFYPEPNKEQWNFFLETLLENDYFFGLKKEYMKLSTNNTNSYMKESKKYINNVIEKRRNFYKEFNEINQNQNEND